ncbi:sensor histidine kinase [Pediococcus siamensis]|uniref:sensor histidine kinase n=1 Tax=Pediococcus siamensis TaxID=381829 RepID=UPI0039A31BF5
MKVLIVVCGLLCLVCGYLLFILIDVRRVINQLDEISQDPTNKELSLHSQNRLVKKLAQKINLLLNKHAKSEQQLYQLKNEQDVAIHNIAHDLRTPLTVASGYTQVLLHEQALSTEDRESLARIEQNLNSVAKHLDLLLMYNRLNEHEIALHWQRVNITKMLQKMVLGMYEAFTSKKIELNLNIQSNCWWVVDREALQRICQNLLGNILQHGTTAAKITLRGSENQLEMKFENQLTVPIKNPERLTNRFYTEDLARQSKNAGLGLYITEKLAQLMMGSVTITTQGTTFAVTLKFTKQSL